MILKRTHLLLLALLSIGLYAAGPSLEAKRIAVIIGTNYKGNDAGIPPLDLCEADAKLMEQSLKAHGRYDDAKVLLGSMVTASRIQEAMKEVAAKSSADDSVFFYFSGHGTYQRDSNAPNGLRNYIVMFNRPHVSDKELSDWMSGIKGKITFVFDCCFSGGIVQKGRRGVGDIPVAENSPGTVIENGGNDFYFKDAVLIGSSDANETSIEIRGSVNHGVFTYYFAQGLNPANGDLNSDRSVTLYEAFTWSAKRVTDHAKKFNHKQTPQLRGNASGYVVTGQVEPVKPPVQDNKPEKPEDNKPEVVTPQPDVSPQKPPADPVQPADPVTNDEPAVVDNGPTQQGGFQICTTILKSRQAGPTPLDPMVLLKKKKLGDDVRKIRVLLSEKEYKTSIQWLDENQFKAICGEQVPLGFYSFKEKVIKNQVALLTVSGIPAGVHELKIEADDYPEIKEVLGVEKRQNGKMLVVASLAGFGTIRGKVFYKNFEQPLPGQEVWMPTTMTTNQQYKMKTTSDGAFWFLNLPPSRYYNIKASFLENLDLDNKQLEVKAGAVTTVDVVLSRKSVKE